MADQLNVYMIKQVIENVGSMLDFDLCYII